MAFAAGHGYYFSLRPDGSLIMVVHQIHTDQDGSGGVVIYPTPVMVSALRNLLTPPKKRFWQRKKKSAIKIRSTRY
jgi:hypothetical protein